MNKAPANKETEERERRLAEDIWLNYLNRYLFEKGTISEKEYKRMTEKIAQRCARIANLSSCR